jgi:hypothetical protein
MSIKSFPFSKQNSQEPNYRGGEKKVMKKSLSVVLSTAMAVSVFASAAFAETAPATTTTGTAATVTAVKTSADFKDLAGIDAALKAKIDAMLAKGFFEGVSADSFGINENMTRAQFAKILALVAGVTVDESVKTSSFADVKADDAANSWAIPFIEAAKKAGLIDGKSSTSYDPGAKVTLGELATALVKATGGKVDTTGTPWYADAVKQAVTLKVLPEGTDGSKFALRSDLVVGAHGTVAVIDAEKAPAKLSATELKATGAKKLTVTFNKAVEDAAKVKLTVAKGAASIALASTDGIKFSDDKKSAVLTTDSKLTEGTYTVKVEAAAADNGVVVDQATAEAKVENEKIGKVEFVTATEVLAKNAVGQPSTVEFKATNQYGEVSDLAASRFNVVYSLGTITSDAEKQELRVDLSSAVKDNQFAVTIIAPNATAQVTKFFKVGDPATVAKVVMGDVKMDEGKERITAGDTVSFDLKVYDQYGSKLSDDTLVQTKTTKISTNTGVVNNTTDMVLTANKLTVNTQNSISVDTDVTLSLVPNGSGEMVSKTIKVTAPKKPHEVSFGNFTDTVAKNDSGTYYLPLVVTDQFGKTLTADEIVTAASASPSKFTVFSGNNGVVANAVIQLTGEHKGKVAISGFANTGSAQITVIVNGSGKSNTTNVSVVEARTPQTVYISSDAKGKFVQDAYGDIKFKVKDQYGKDLSSAVSNYRVDLKLENVSGNTYSFDLYNAGTNNGTATPVQVTTENVGITYSTIGSEQAYALHAGAAKKGTSKLVAKLVKTENVNGSNVDVVVSSVEKNITVIDEREVNLTYAVAIDKSVNNTVYAINDNTKAPFVKAVKVSAKDEGGKEVQLKSNALSQVYTSNAGVVDVTGTSIFGKTKGTASVTAAYKTLKGDYTATMEVIVKDEVAVVDSITASKTSKSIAASDLDGTIKVWDAKLMEKLTVKDQYGDEFVNEKLTSSVLDTYNTIFNVKYYVSDIKRITGQTANDVVAVDAATGAVTYTANGALDISSFVLKAVAPNGKTAEITVTVY